MRNVELKVRGTSVHSEQKKGNCSKSLKMDKNLNSSSEVFKQLNIMAIWFVSS